MTDLHARGPNGSVATPGNPKGTPCMAASHLLTKQVLGNNHPTTTAYTIGQGYGDSPRDDLHSPSPDVAACRRTHTRRNAGTHTTQSTEVVYLYTPSPDGAAQHQSRRSAGTYRGVGG